MMKKRNREHLMWEKGWAGHERAQLLRMAALSFGEKLRWLEETQDLIQVFKQKGLLLPQNKDSYR